MGSRDFDKRFKRTQSIISVLFVVTFVAIIAYWVSLGLLAFKAVDALDKECKGSIAYCLGKAKKAFDEGANE